MFSCSVRVELGDGVSARFWIDAWLPVGQIKAFAPHLFRAVGKRFLKTSVKDAIFQHRWVRHISGAHTVPVLYEYLDLWEKLESVQLRPLVGNRFVWRWTPYDVYSASSFYRSFFLGRQGGMEGLGATEGEILFLAHAPSVHLDDGSQEEAWALGFHGVRPLRPGGRDSGPSVHFLRFHKGILVSLASPLRLGAVVAFCSLSSVDLVDGWPVFCARVASKGIRF